MEDLIAPIAFMLIIGGVSGYFAGTILKRIAGMAVAVGIIAFTAIALVYTGTMDINIESIITNISNVLNIVAPLGIVAIITSVPFVASFVAGLFIGYRRY